MKVKTLLSVVLVCAAFLATVPAYAAPVRVLEEDYVNIVPLFVDMWTEENNIYEVPVGTRWHYVAAGPYAYQNYYAPPAGVPWALEHYESFADYPDQYYLHRYDGMFPPDRTDLFELAD